VKPGFRLISRTKLVLVSFALQSVSAADETPGL